MKRFLPFLAFFLILGLARVFSAVAPESYPNLQPYGALIFCGMALFGWRGVLIPAIAWIATYPITNLQQGYGISAFLLIPLIGFIVMFFFASFFRNKSNGTIFIGSLFSAVLFYLVTNSMSWLIDPNYAKTVTGFTQALWLGLPQYSATPTWMFFRNALAAQALFSGLFLLAIRGFQPFPRKVLATSPS